MVAHAQCTLMLHRDAIHYGSRYENKKDFSDTSDHYFQAKKCVTLRSQLYLLSYPTKILSIISRMAFSSTNQRQTFERCSNHGNRPSRVDMLLAWLLLWPRALRRIIDQRGGDFPIAVQK